MNTLPDRSKGAALATEDFARLVSLACHDLRTPLATVSGFAHTLERLDELGDPAARYIGMIEAASEQMAELLGELALVARIEAGRYEPNVVEADTLELAREAAGRVEHATASGAGGTVRVDSEPVERGLAALALCACRHGAVDHVELVAEGSTVTISPVNGAAAPIVLAEDMKDLGAAAARRLVEALGGTLSLDGDRLLVRLPEA